MYHRFGKRIFDLAITLPLLILLTPLLGLIALLVYIDSTGPVLFVQERLGQHGRIFRIYKFRTMTHRVRTHQQEIIGRDAEITHCGYWLRRFKLDELPQLLNVVKGELSLVGPRPALPEQLTQYDENGRKRLLVRPGLTGLAQVHGNIYLSWPERWYYDAMYVDQLSFGLDLWIIARTVKVLVVGEDKLLRRPTTTEEERGI